MLISLIHPSRGRASKAKSTHDEWIDKAGCDVEYVLSLDSSDSSIGNYRDQFKNVLTVAVSPNKSVVEASNRASKLSTGDILIYLSDDFQCPDNWGQLIINEFKKYNGPILIKVDDCLQPLSTKVLTIPMMNRELYNKLGYFWHPDYKSMFVDEDLYWTVDKLNALMFAPRLKFPHIHPANPNPSMRCDNDETYKRSAANWEQGKAVFAKRKAAGFPL